jgi:hypothetical protein
VKLVFPSERGLVCMGSVFSVSSSSEKWEVVYEYIRESVTLLVAEAVKKVYKQ